MSLLTNPILAKLLAKENLEVRHGNYRTAWFDVQNRVLGLPIWKDHGKDVYDLLVGHEVGHALFTPSEGWHESNEEIKGCPRGYLNVIEDVRIERKIRETYPGLISPMRRGYKVLVEKGFFGDIDNYDMDKMKLIDKINVKSKLSTEVMVTFNAEEQILFDRSLVAETWSEVVQIVRDILAYTKALEDNKVELPQAQSEQGDENDDDSDTNETQPSVTAAPEEDEEEDGDSQSLQSDSEPKEAESPEGDYEPKAAKPEHSDEETSVTDEIFRAHEQDLLDTDEDGKQSIFVREMSKEQRNMCTITYAQLAFDRECIQRAAFNDFSKFELSENLPGEFAQYYKAIKKSIIPAVKEFEMRKAAYQYQRSSSAKTGSINVNQVHSYKFNDDIFKRVSLQADAKNHGMFLLVDFSGSMFNTIANALDQVSHLVAFCKATNIPFEVYGFSSNNDNTSNDFQEGTMDLDDLSLFQLTSSTLKKKDFEISIYQMWLRQYIHGDKGFNLRVRGISARQVYAKVEDFGSTPLHQALIVSYHLVKEMILKNNIEKMNFVTLTDGDSNTLRVYRSYDTKNRVPNSLKSYTIALDKKRLNVSTSGSREISKMVLEQMSSVLGTTNIGFFIAEQNREMNQRCAYVIHDITGNWHYSSKDTNAEFRKNRCVAFQNTLGYSEYYILKSGNLTTAEDDGFESLDAGTSKGKLNSEFKKFSKSKKTNRVLMTKFAKAVA